MKIIDNRWHDENTGIVQVVQEQCACKNDTEVTHKGDYLHCKHCRIEELQKQLDATRLEHRKEYDRAEMETGRAKDAEAQLDAVLKLPDKLRRMAGNKGLHQLESRALYTCANEVKAALQGEGDE